jgi:hypothetical protein
LSRIKIDLVRAKGHTTTFDPDLRISETGVYVCSNNGTVTLKVYSQCSVVCGFVPTAPKVIDWEPMFDEVLNSMRSNKLMFHLRLKTSALKLNVLATSSVLVHPNIAVVISCPMSIFLPGISMIGYMDYSQSDLS